MLDSVLLAPLKQLLLEPFAEEDTFIPAGSTASLVSLSIEDIQSKLV